MTTFLLKYAAIAAAVVSLLVGLYGGYKLGASGKDVLQTQLAQIQADSKQLQLNTDFEKKALKDELSSINALHDRKLKEITDAREVATLAWKSESAKKDEKILALTTSAHTTEARIAGLKKTLPLASSVKESENILREINKEQAILAATRTQTSGLQCLSVPIPDNFVALLNR